MYHSHIKDFLKTYDDVAGKIDKYEELNKDEERFLVDMELNLAKAIIDDYSRCFGNNDNPAVKVAKIILAAAGKDNLIRVEIK